MYWILHTGVTSFIMLCPLKWWCYLVQYVLLACSSQEWQLGPSVFIPIVSTCDWQNMKDATPIRIDVISQFLLLLSPIFLFFFAPESCSPVPLPSGKLT